jgi:thiamine-monophosphate kinase
MKTPEDKKTSISELGKFGLIEHITTNFRSVNRSTVTGPGDDSAIIESGKLLTLVSTDLLLEGIHFNLIYTPLKHLGYKAVIRAISDIYAMNGTPGQVLIAIGISSRFSVEQIEEIYEGVNLACTNYAVDLAGGDTTSSLTGLTIGVTAVGTVERDRIVRRDGARPNDLICVTGDLGAAYMGLQILERERKLFEKEKVTQPDLAGYEYVIGRQLKPEVPLETLSEIHNAGIQPSSMIDITEGLVPDLFSVCKSSNTGCRIYSDKIPIDYETSRLAEEFNINPLIPSLNGGEDYELLFSVAPDQFVKIQMIASVKVIGHMTSKESGIVLVDDNGSEVELSQPVLGQKR